MYSVTSNVVSMLLQVLRMSSSTTEKPLGVDQLVSGGQLMWGDILVIVVYFIAVIGVGLWVSTSYGVA